MTTSDLPSAATPEAPAPQLSAAGREPQITGAERIANRAIIGHAKVLLMTRGGMSEPEAYRWIQKTAMDRRTQMVVISRQIIDNQGDSASLAS
jgi:hypothetical protein